jgi:hypothetical protein
MLSIMDELKPWEIDSALSEDRLRFLGELLIEVREGVMRAQQPEKGDASWGGGCRAYERTLFNLVRASASGDLPWLYAVYFNSNRLQIDLKVGGVPLFYFRGDSENPTSRHVNRINSQINLFPEDSSFLYSWIMVLEADRDGNPLRVVIAQMDESGNTRNRWVAAETRQRAEAVVPMPTREGPELPPPQIEGPSSNSTEESEDGSRPKA